MRQQAEPRIGRQDVVRSAIRIRMRQAQTRQVLGHMTVRLLALGGSLWLVFTFLLGAENVRGNDMYPALRDGDLAIFLRVGGWRNEDVVLYRGGIGRIQGTEGMAVNKTGANQLVIDGNIQPVQKRLGIFSETKLRKGDRLPCPSRVPRGCFLILGDNREAARDSRNLGFIQERELKGKVFMVIKRRSI